MFSTLDVQSGYWQVKIADKDKEKTTFSANGELWEFKIMSVGLGNAPTTFEPLVVRVPPDVREGTEDDDDSKAPKMIWRKCGEMGSRFSASGEK